MNINNTTDFGTVKIVMLKGEKGDQGPAGATVRAEIFRYSPTSRQLMG